ncbi:pirin family protein [bacterium SCSIO 12643]|nr:pirin family protein [bacterium SCSIO 12643]
MDRKSFLKKALIAGSVGAIAPTVLASEKDSKNQNDIKVISQEGFNHIPNKEIRTMKTVLHKANTRGQANHGWLKANHSFSFANYYNPERMNFGVLRVLNDDHIAPGAGFPTHPHDNMEIITIPLSGQVEHKDSMGNSGVISPGEIQVMSAGTGIQHSEFNKNKDQDLKLLQIWVFPNQKQVTPRYDQHQINATQQINGFRQILSPSSNDDGVWIHQNAWFHLGEMNSSEQFTYELRDKNNGVYIFLIEGNVQIEGENLSARDGLGAWDSEELLIKSQAKSKVLVMEVPLRIN